MKRLVWSDKINKWILLLRCKGKQIYLNYFSTELEASEAYENELKTLNNL